MQPVVQPPDQQAPSSAPSDPVYPVFPPGMGTAVWRDRLSQLLESTGEGIFGIDLNGCCTFINRAGAEQLGWLAAELLGRNMHEAAHHTHADSAHYPEHLCPIFNAFRKALPCRMDTGLFWRKNGSAFAVEYASYPIVEGGMVQGAVVTFVDISARRQAEDALRQAHAVPEQRVCERTYDLSEALAQLSELSACTHTVREDERTRIAREVHDVGRHARASDVAIAIQATANDISISVRDNGCGADASAFEAGDAYGVKGMRERARHLVSSLDISSKKAWEPRFTCALSYKLNSNLMTTQATLRIRKILIGDDHRIVREGLKQVLAGAPEIGVVAEAVTGPGILQRLDVLGGHDGLAVMLLDIALPGRDDMDVLQARKRTGPGFRC